MDLRLYRRYEELTQWEAFVFKHFPITVIPKNKKERQRLHKQVDETLLQDPDFLTLHNQFHTKIDLAIELLHSAIAHRLRFIETYLLRWPIEMMQNCGDAKSVFDSIFSKQLSQSTAGLVL